MFEMYLSTVDEKSALICGLSDFIWDHAEVPYTEYESAGEFCRLLEKEGFTVTRGAADIPTAFTATFGDGAPHIGVLAEYDALSGLSQEANVTEKKYKEGPDIGHGCGHNLFAGGSFGAVLAIKSFIEDTGKGKVTLFGCPAEEGGNGKVYMARAGVFTGVDAVVSWHPEKMYMPRTRPALALISKIYSFTGVASHAGGSPHLGRSALDAVELMNVGANFLREHMPLTCRVHYAIIDTGGEAPNIVQSHAKVKYMVRAETLDDVLELSARVDRIAQGAALMTDTTFETKFVSACSNLITIPTLQKTALEAMNDLPFPVPTEEELSFGKALRATMPLTSKEKQETAIYADRVLPLAPPAAHGGSTDTSDVSWNTPTVQMHIGNWVKGTPGHSWQAVTQGKSSYAHKSMLYASKAVAGTALRLISDPSLIEKAKAEHFEQTQGKYVCPIPADVNPPIPQK
ncbi:MAG: amidohydrolase [Clostridia bacterium]|nr:amidohydrolase [Clostridia bacterium]